MRLGADTETLTVLLFFFRDADLGDHASLKVTTHLRDLQLLLNIENRRQTH